MAVIEAASCNECNDVANKGLSTNLVKSAIANNAVLVKLKKIPEEFYGPGVLYQMPTEFLAYCFWMQTKIYWI